MFRVKVAGEGNLRDLARDLRRAGGSLRPQLTSRLRRETKSVHDAVRRQVLTGSMAARRVPGATERFPATVGAGNHVRRPALSGLAWKVSTSAGNPRAEVTWNPNAINPRVRPLFPYLVGQKRRLRHPIPPGRGTWVSQQMPNAWEPTRRLVDGAQKAARAAIDHAADTVAGRK